MKWRVTSLPINKEIDRILVIGSGPVKIGQAAEFDYSGTQACLSFREEGLFVVLLNPNPASIQTDDDIANKIYIEQVTTDNLVSIIKKEGLRYIYPSVGGQTALNAVFKLKKLGFLDQLNVGIIGTPVEFIEIAEDRKAFSDLILKIGEPLAPSKSIASAEEIALLEDDLIPCIGRTSFSLGGLGGRIFRSKDELKSFFLERVQTASGETLEIQKSLEGLKEFEYELIRDGFGNKIVVCNMENLDPMGVHTGESVVVTPAQTLNDSIHQRMRSSAFRIIEALKIIGACNIQFAVGDKGDFYVVEVNPRTSRSSALASKASGYPISRIASKLVIGYNLAEVRNPVTGTTFASFEPSLDYVTVKIPRWPFEKFAVSRKIGIQMKSIGEVMGIGRTFEEALMKAIASLETYESIKIRNFFAGEKLEHSLAEASDVRLYSIFEAQFQNLPVRWISEKTGYDPYFVQKIGNVVEKLKLVEIGKIPDCLMEFKQMGISDAQISAFSGLPEEEIIRFRIKNNILPSYRRIDTCSGEFKSVTPYYYSTYSEDDELEVPEMDTILIVGAGPNRIGQGVEFDYSAVKGVKALRSLGKKAAIINSNPETVSTDFDISDALFFEPVTLEHTANLVKKLKPEGVIVQFSGQTGQNMAAGLGRLFGEEILTGTKPSEIYRIEERNSFAGILRSNGIEQPDFVTISNEEDLTRTISGMEPPYILRSSFIIGGRAMDIIFDKREAIERARIILIERPEFPVLVSRYIENAEEIDIDFTATGKEFAICGVMPHIEEAGTHSGDATMLLSPDLEPEILEDLKVLISKLTNAFSLEGLCNLQVARKGSKIYVIELNARASRSIPFICKATGIDWVKVAIEGMLSIRREFPSPQVISYFLKIPVFPFDRYEDLEPLLGPEMKSTGEAMFSGKSFQEAASKASSFLGVERLENGIILSIRNTDKPLIVDLAAKLKSRGVPLYATPGTHEFLAGKGIATEQIFKLEDLREPKIDSIILEKKPSLVINTPSMSSGAVRDGFRMRRVCLISGTPLITNIRLASMIVDSIISGEKTECRPISDYRK